MPTPTERLEAKKQVSACKVCQWLATLDESTRREWQKAIVDPRFGAALVATEMSVDGADVGEASVRNHREKRHR